jgi:hypothetical protein
LASRGHSVITDDIAALNVGSDGSLRVIAGPAALKLRPDVAGVVPIRDEVQPTRGDRTVWQPRQERPSRKIPLGAICHLAVDEAVRTTRLDRHDAVGVLLKNLYAARFAGAACIKRTHMEGLASIASSVPVYRVTRTDNIENLEGFSDLLEAELKGELMRRQAAEF